MDTIVRLTVLTGPHKNRKFCFCGSTECLVGRGSDCFIQFSGALKDLSISRNHCRLEVAPSAVRVKDLGSLNGTYINGKKVRPVGSKKPEAANPDEAEAALLNDGDLLCVGGTTLKVDFVTCPPPGREADGCPLWQAGETTKKDCPLQC